MRTIVLIILLISLLFTAPAYCQNLTPPTDRTIFLLGEINDASVQAVIDQLRTLDKASPGKEIELDITSPGGGVYAGLNLYDAIEGLSSPVNTVCVGMCASMAAVILASGHTRSATPHATIMFHQLALSVEPTKLTIAIDEIQEGIRLQKMIDAIISKHSGLSLNKVQELEAYDHYLSPIEAKKLGLIDHILGE